MTARKKETFLILIFILSFVSLSVVFVNILAVHDIHHDYVSQSVLKQVGIEGSEALPDWSRCDGEWLLVTISHLILLPCLIILIIFLFKLKSSKSEES